MPSRRFAGKNPTLPPRLSELLRNIDYGCVVITGGHITWRDQNTRPRSDRLCGYASERLETLHSYGLKKTVQAKLFDTCQF